VPLPCCYGPVERLRPRWPAGIRKSSTHLHTLRRAAQQAETVKAPHATTKPRRRAHEEPPSLCSGSAAAPPSALAAKRQAPEGDKRSAGDRPSADPGVRHARVRQPVPVRVSHRPSTRRFSNHGFQPPDREVFESMSLVRHHPTPCSPGLGARNVLPPSEWSSCCALNIFLWKTTHTHNLYR